MPSSSAPRSAVAIPYGLRRIGELMSPRPGDPLEVEGTLNPATAMAEDGTLYLYPRIVAAGNVSRVARARVQLEGGVPVGVQREAVALEPERGWEHGAGHGGVEDPRITTIPSLGLHVMSYVAFGPLGPHPALAISRDAHTWQRLGPLQFGYEDTLDVDLNLYPNKDVVFFPEVVPDPDGTPSYAVLHRPMWDFSFSRAGEPAPLPAGLTDERPGIWISYMPEAEVLRDVRALTRPSGHRLLALPEFAWEALKIGAGPAPVRVDEGWLLLHHGVTGSLEGSAFAPQKQVRYAAGAMLLDAQDPSRVLARTPEPLLEPEVAAETTGTVANVVFPTAIQPTGGRTYVFYGMADSAIGVAELVRG